MLIKKNGTVIDVTKGAFKSLFADNGWKETTDSADAKGIIKYMTPQPSIVQIKEEPKTEMPFDNMMDEFEDEAEEYDVVLEDMTVRELIRFAHENGIDLNGKTRKDDIIRVIEQGLEEE